LDQNRVELYWDRPREEWPYDKEGNLAISTRLLDVKGLLAELNEVELGSGPKEKNYLT
jgi:catechol 2,3-dioxygenase